ncbi:MAG: hypothetical protein ACP5IL_02965 [Syntrophobacteraceae bacterium]
MKGKRLFFADYAAVVKGERLSECRECWLQYSREPPKETVAATM